MELVNTHCHCVYSGHGTGTIAEYADAAAAAGLTTLAFTEHFPLSAAFDPDEYLSMRPQMVDAYLAEIDEARARHPQIEFVTGTEMDYLGALEDRQLTEEALAPFRFRLLSVHFIDGWAFDDPDQKARWKEPGAPDAIWRRYGELWCEAASNASLPYDAMSHPDLAKKFGYYPSFSLESLYDEMAAGARRRPHGGGEHVGRLLRLRRDVPGPGAARRLLPRRRTLHRGLRLPRPGQRGPGHRAGLRAHVRGGLQKRYRSDSHRRPSKHYHRIGCVRDKARRFRSKKEADHMGLFNKADKASTEALSKRGESHLAPRTFNMTIGGLEKALLKEFPAEDAEKWDRTGLLVGERSLPVTRVAVALDATPAAVAAAAEAGANVLLTHHPAFLEAPDGFAPEASALESPGAVVWAAIRNQVALMDFHTALDVSPAAARVLPGMLGLKFTLRFADPLEGSRRKGYGQICEVPDNDGEPETLALLAARCMAVFGRAPRVWGAPDAAVRRVVTATGSAGSLAPALVAAGVDAVVCGEMKYHTALELAAAHVAVIELGHDVSELPLAAVLAEALARVGVPAEAVTLVDQSENWWTPEAVRV